MTNLRSIGGLVLAASALLVGCGKSDSGRQQLQLNSFIAKAADTVCSALAKCSCTESSAVASCKQAYVSDMTDQLDYALLDYPGQTIDPVAAQTCLDDLEAELSDCALSPGTMTFTTGLVGRAAPRVDIPACNQILKGVQAAGERCTVDEECTAGLACERVERVCATPAGVGGDCTAISCADTAWCYSGTCTAKLAAGEDCSLRGNDACAAELSCFISISHGHFICASPVAVDGTCGDGTPCVTGTYCDDSDVCVPLIADGADCDYDSQCEHGWCNAQNVCENPGICSFTMGPK